MLFSDLMIFLKKNTSKMFQGTGIIYLHVKIILGHSNKYIVNKILYSLLDRETVFTCLYPNTVQTRLSRDQRPTKPVSRLGTGRGVGGKLKCY